MVVYQTRFCVLVTVALVVCAVGIAAYVNYVRIVKTTVVRRRRKCLKSIVCDKEPV